MPSEATIRSSQAEKAAAARWDPPTVRDIARDYAAAEIEVYVHRVVATAPPLTIEQQARIATLLAASSIGWSSMSGSPARERRGPQGQLATALEGEVASSVGPTRPPIHDLDDGISDVPIPTHHSSTSDEIRQLLKTAAPVTPELRARLFALLGGSLSRSL